MLRIEIQPSHKQAEFNVIAELDPQYCGEGTPMPEEMSCGFTVGASNYDEALLLAFKKLNKVLKAFQPNSQKSQPQEEVDDPGEDLILEVLQGIFGEDKVRSVKVPVQDTEMKGLVDELMKMADVTPNKPDFELDDQLDSLWDDIEKNYSLGDK